MSPKYSFIIFMLLFSLNLHSQDFIVAFDSTAMPEVAVGEVYVSASKDRLKLKEMPASVSVLSSTLIRDGEIRSLADVTSMAPNFFMPDYGSKLTSPVYIRGIGSRIDAPSVGLYIDNVPYFEKASFNTDFFDIERIEVLRGPQGTLYGRNTMAGIINIVTLSPMVFQGTTVNMSAGSYGAYNFNAGHYGKKNENFGYSLSANFLHNSGFFINEFDGSPVDKMNSAGIRNRLAWVAGKRLTLENIASWEWSDQGGYPYAVFNDSTQSPEPVNYNQYSTYFRQLVSDALVAKYSAESVLITSTTSYQYLRDNQEIDQDFTPQSLYFVKQRQSQNMLSQEVTAKSESPGRYQWLSGLYGFMQMFDKSVDVDVYTSGTTSYKKYDHVIAGAALFHQSALVDFLTPGLTLTAGLRLDFEKDILNYKYDVLSSSLLTSMADTVYPALASLELLPKLAINYSAGRSNFYAVIARGYKTGGYNSTFERPEDLTFKPEHSWNYEAGIKTSLPGNLFADVALFYIDWRNQQIYQTVPSGRGSMLKNAGHSVSKGAELTLKATPLKGLDASLGYGFTYATFITNKVNDLTDYSGNFIPYVPRHTVALQASQTINVRNSRLLDRIKLSLTGRGAGIIYWNEANDHSQDFYTTADAKVSLIRRSFQFDFWGKNITGTDYESFYFTALNRKYVQMGKPARFGINLSMKF
ncbi:MAG: TonB-dependent receptor [Bacteroidia bacterium]|nr:MAG: TonB-dependent receptor [Bacteroidia bacterium]